MWSAAQILLQTGLCLCKDKAMRNSFRHFPMERESKEKPLCRNLMAEKISPTFRLYLDVGGSVIFLSLVVYSLVGGEKTFANVLSRF